MMTSQRERNWARFAQSSYLYKDPNEQRSLLAQLQKHWDLQSHEVGERSTTPHRRGYEIDPLVKRSCQSGAQRLIFSSFPWEVFSDSIWQFLKRWLGEDDERQVIFLECQVRGLALALSGPQALGLFENHQMSVHCCWGIHGDIARQLLASELAHHRFDLQIFDDQAHWGDFFQGMLLRAGQIRGIGEELLKAPNTAAFSLRNGPHQAGDGSVMHLRGALQDLPVILCGAGPSLKGDLEFLAKCRTHTLIIACGSAALALKRAQIAPHMVSTICPLRASFERWQQLDTFTTPALTCLRIFPGVDELIAGPRLHLTGLSSAPSTLWVEKALGFEKPDLNFGTSVLTATLRTCLFMGCDPIFLAGVDLCYGKTGDKYTAGVQKIRALSGEVGLLAPLLAAGTKGQVLTNWPWLTESRYIQEMAAGHPSRQILRCAKRGLEIPGVELGSLAAWAKRCHAPRDLDNLLWNQLEEAYTAPKNWQICFKSMRESLHRCLERFRCQRRALISIPPWERGRDTHLVRAQLENLEIERGRELAFDTLFRPLQEALEHLEFDELRCDLRRSPFGEEQLETLTNRLLLQQAADRLLLFEKKGEQYLSVLNQQLSSMSEHAEAHQSRSPS